MAEDRYAEIRIETSTEISDTLQAGQRYLRLLQWLATHHNTVFNRDESHQKNFVAAWWPADTKGSPEEEPVLRFFARRSNARQSAQEHPEGVFEYRYADQMELLL